jgi:hypothetical protein
LRPWGLKALPDLKALPALLVDLPDPKVHLAHLELLVLWAFGDPRATKATRVTVEPPVRTAHPEFKALAACRDTPATKALAATSAPWDRRDPPDLAEPRALQGPRASASLALQDQQVPPDFRASQARVA